MLEGYKTYIVVVIAICVQVLFRMDYIYKSDRDDLMMMIAAAATATIAHKMNRMESDGKETKAVIENSAIIDTQK